MFLYVLECMENIYYISSETTDNINYVLKTDITGQDAEDEDDTETSVIKFFQTNYDNSSYNVKFNACVESYSNNSKFYNFYCRILLNVGI